MPRVAERSMVRSCSATGSRSASSSTRLGSAAQPIATRKLSRTWREHGSGAGGPRPRTSRTGEASTWSSLSARRSCFDSRGCEHHPGPALRPKLGRIPQPRYRYCGGRCRLQTWASQHRPSGAERLLGMERTSVSVNHALKRVHGRSGGDRRPVAVRPMTSTRHAAAPPARKPAPRNGVRPAVTARGRELLAQQRREAA